MSPVRASVLVILVALACAGTALAKPDGTSKMPAKRASDYEVGKRLWMQSCWQCHGERGEGDGPAAAALPGGVPTLRGRLPADKLDDLVKVVDEGRGRMPAFGEDIDNRDSRRVLEYVRGVLEGRPPPPSEKDADGDEADEGR